GGTTTGTTSVAVHNANPTVTLTGVPATTPEGKSLTFRGTVSDPGLLDTLAYAWTVRLGSTVLATGTAPSLPFTPDDNGTYTVCLTVTDKDGGVGSQTQTFSVSNVAPAVTVSGSSGAVRGQGRTFTFTANDPSLIDAAAGFTYVVI